MKPQKEEPATKTMSAVTDSVKQKTEQFRKSLAGFGGSSGFDKAASGYHEERIKELTSEIEELRGKLAGNYGENDALKDMAAQLAEKDKLLMERDLELERLARANNMAEAEKSEFKGKVQ